MLTGQEYNSISLTHFAATIASAIGVEKPGQSDGPIEWACTLLKEYCREVPDRLFIHNPDAIAMWMYNKYQYMFEPVLKHTQLSVPFQTVMPSVTPVCFGTMYTGVLPEVHGIQKYEKPVITVDSLFDSLIRAGRKIAIIARQECSMSKIFLERNMDYIILPEDDQVVATALEIISKDQYDCLFVYTFDYDGADHKYGPEHELSIKALKGQISYFDQMVTHIKKEWKDHNTLIAFSTDHGVHATPGDPKYAGKHGTDSPLDLNIMHFLGIVGKQITA